MENQSMENYAALVSMDWGERLHEYAVCQGNGLRERGKVEHLPEALTEWLLQLRKRFPGGPIAICLEQSRGALVYFLMRFEFVVLYLVNPLTVSKFREALYPSGGKDDLRDADLLLDLLEKHRNKLRAWNPEPECVRELDLLNQHRRTIVDDITRLTNRLRAALKAYYPQALFLAGELNTILACDFLQKWPSLALLKKAKPQQIEKFYRKHNCRSNKLLGKRMAAIKNAIAITEDAAICSVQQLTVESITEQLIVLLSSLKRFDDQLQSVFDQYPEKELYEALPGAGRVLQPRLATIFGLDRRRWESAKELQCFSGIAPITEQSGSQRPWIHWRIGCPKFVRQSLTEFAHHSRAKSIWAGAYYNLQRYKGKSHNAALRALAFKWLRILFRCWKNEKPYDENIYLAALQKRQSPLLKFIAQSA